MSNAAGKPRASRRAVAACRCSSCSAAGRAAKRVAGSASGARAAGAGAGAAAGTALGTSAQVARDTAIGVSAGTVGGISTGMAMGISASASADSSAGRGGVDVADAVGRALVSWSSSCVSCEIPECSLFARARRAGTGSGVSSWKGYKSTPKEGVKSHDFPGGSGPGAGGMGDTFWLKAAGRGDTFWSRIPTCFTICSTISPCVTPCFTAGPGRWRRRWSGLPGGGRGPWPPPRQRGGDGIGHRRVPG